MWGHARRTGRRVLLRIEDHDRQRSRPEYETAILEDLADLGFEADEGPLRQSDDAVVYAAAVELLRFNGRVYACDCTRSTAAAWDISDFPHLAAASRGRRPTRCTRKGRGRH